MASQPRTITPAKLYGEAGLIYIRYHATIESKPNGQKRWGVPAQLSARFRSRSPTSPALEIIIVF